VHRKLDALVLKLNKALLQFPTFNVAEPMAKRVNKESSGSRKCTGCYDQATSRLPQIHICQELLDYRFPHLVGRTVPLALYYDPFNGYRVLDVGGDVHTAISPGR
jgi:hypothetical protein